VRHSVQVYACLCFSNIYTLYVFVKTDAGVSSCTSVVVRYFDVFIILTKSF